MPESAGPDQLFGLIGEMGLEVLQEGVERAVAGDPGEAQDESRASYAAEFTDEERWLDWEAPLSTLRRQLLALNVVGPVARAKIGDAEMLITQIQPHAGTLPPAAVGTVAGRNSDVYVVYAGDGPVDVTAKAIP